MGIYRSIYINSLLKRGRGFAATILFRNILLEIKLKQKEKPFRIFNVAVKKIPPMFFYKKLTLGGLKHNVPVSIHKKKEILISAI
jgi:ribosomal protein S7